MLLLALIGLLLSRIVYTEWRTVHATEAGLAAMRVAYKGLVAAEKVSFERGPANGVLGDADRPDPAKRHRLALARAASDRAMRDVIQAIATVPPSPYTRAAAELLSRAAMQLRAGRAVVDRVSTRPRAQRTPRAVMGAVHAMFDVVPTVLTAATFLSRDAEMNYPQLAYALVAARLAAELREYAGRLGSQFTAALTANKPLAPAEARGAQAMRGRVEELHDLINTRLLATATDRRILDAERSMDAAYFGDDLSFVDGVERAGELRQPYGMDTAQFAARYVPPMGTIVGLRDALVGVAIEEAQRRHDAALRSLATTTAIGAVALSAVCAVIVVLRRRVIRPLEHTARTIAGIARGELDSPLAAVGRNDEIGAVLMAVETLRQTSVEKAELEEERQRLIEELRVTSSTDFLTGLMNRRAFAESAQQHMANARRHGRPLALIIFDIDHFKDVNDRYGHEAGDVVIGAVADIAHAAVRAGDLVCRYGGEEFAALVLECGEADARFLIERIRISIADMPIPVAEGRTVHVTASFGAAVVLEPATITLDELVRPADEALYRAKDEGRNRSVLTLVRDRAAEPPAVT